MTVKTRNTTRKADPPKATTTEGAASAKVDFLSRFPNLTVCVRSPDVEKRPDGRIKYVNGIRIEFLKSRYSTDDPETIEGLRQALGYNKLFHELKPDADGASESTQAA